LSCIAHLITNIVPALCMISSLNPIRTFFNINTSVGISSTVSFAINNQPMLVKSKNDAN
jgi:hypothetical protein